MLTTAPSTRLGFSPFLQPVDLWENSTIEEVDVVIRAVYRQVLGNPHIMDSERLATAESKLRERTYTVREFVRAVAKSDFYRSRYFEKCAPYRFVELNYKHLLGRAPDTQAELSEHIRRCVESGYDAEIDSYIDSTEYMTNFGDDVVPYYRSAQTQVGESQVSYNRSIALLWGPAEVDSRRKSSRLVQPVATNATSKIVAPKSGGRISPAKDATEKTYKILVTGAKFDCKRRRRSTTEYIVSGSKMTPQIQRINRSSGKIVSITEV